MAQLVPNWDEQVFDHFDHAFATSLQGLAVVTADEDPAALNLCADRLTTKLIRHLTDEKHAAVKALGGLHSLMDTLRERLAEQTERHQGSRKWGGRAGPLGLTQRV